MISPLFAGIRGGNPDHVELSRLLTERGHSVYVVTARYDKEPLYEELDGVKIFRVKPLCYLWYIDYAIAFPWLRLYKLISKYRIDIIHAIGTVTTLTFTAAFISRITKKPLILTIQGAATTSADPLADVVKKLYDKSIARFVGRTSKKVITLSNKLDQRALDIGVKRSKIRVVPNGINTDMFNPNMYDSTETKRELGFEPSNLVLGFTGRLVPLKGVEYLLQALEIVRRSAPDVSLLIIGDGPQRSDIENRARNSNLTVKITGWVGRNEIPHYLSAIDIFVCPSLTEGMPVAVIEAMAMQKPIVATNVGGNPDLVEHGKNGFIGPPRDPYFIAGAIQKLATTERLRKQMGQLSRKLIEKKFTWDKLVPKIEKVYEQSLSLKPSVA